MSDDLKRAAARDASEWIRDGMVLGLGTGSTVYYLLEEIRAQRSRGSLKNIVGVPTSDRTAEIAHQFGIPLTNLEERETIDLTIDGADEVDPGLQVIKGLGGALLRERIVATASALVLIVIDISKRVPRLGTTAPLPVEVDPFCGNANRAFFSALGAEAVLRLNGDGSVFTTDGGNNVVDCRFAHGIDHPEELERRLNGRPGVLGTGLFLDLADHVLTASSTGVETISRGDARP